MDLTENFIAHTFVYHSVPEENQRVCKEVVVGKRQVTTGMFVAGINIPEVTRTHVH